MDPGLSWGLFSPLVVAALVYVALYTAGNVVEGRGHGESAERVRDLSFAVALVAAAYTALLLVIAVVGRPGEFFDMVRVVLVVSVFFLLLLLVFFGIFELIASRGRRRSPP
jgi:thiol:disulfide interchange protein